MRRSLVLVLAGVVAVAAVGALVWWRSQPGTDLERAVRLAPEGTQRVSWTDWAGVRRELGSDVSASSSPSEVGEMLDGAFDRDLSATTALGESAEGLQEHYGISPASVEWEMFAQSPRGAVDVLKVPDSFDLDALAERLEGLGFRESDGVWEGGGDLVARIDPSLSPEVQHVAIDEDARLVRTSDSATYLRSALDADPAEGLDDVVEASGEPLTASVYDAAYACSRLAMSQADETDQERADALVEEAGGITPLTGFAMSAQVDGQVRVALSFETDEQARADADARAELASGPAPGQGGDFTDRFEVVGARAEGRVVVLDLQPAEGAYVLSDLASGPVLFATC